MNNIREDFERWAISEGWDADCFIKDDKGDYETFAPQDMWSGYDEDVGGGGYIGDGGSLPCSSRNA